VEFGFKKEEFNGFGPLLITFESDLEKRVFLVSRSETKASPGCLEFQSPVAVLKASSSCSCLIRCYKPRRLLPFKIKGEWGEIRRKFIRRYRTKHFCYTVYLKLFWCTFSLWCSFKI